MSFTITDDIELSVVMPCLNEAQTLQTCIEKAFGYMARNDIRGEVVIGDNGSTDNSKEIAERCGARVIYIPEKGYGNALYGAMMASRGKYIITGDSDDSYDFGNLDPFMEKLREGYDMVMGNRFKGEIKPGAMPLLHKYLGNPVLSFVGRWFTKTSVGDFHCGLRGLRKAALERLDLRSPGMEFASEMIVQASIVRLSIAEVPITLYKDGRNGASHLRTWRDGWRHLRLLLKYSPKYLSFIHTALTRTDHLGKQPKEDRTTHPERVAKVKPRMEV